MILRHPNKTLWTSWNRFFFYLTGEKSKLVQNLKSLQYSVILRQLTVVENAGQDRLSRQVSMPAEFGESYGNYAEKFFSLADRLFS